MKTNRVIRTSIAALTITAAALGFAIAADDKTEVDFPIVKTDRFEQTESALCGGQTWPHYRADCVTWLTGKNTDQSLKRYVTREIRDEKAKTSTLVRVEVNAGTTVALK